MKDQKYMDGQDSSDYEPPPKYTFEFEDMCEHLDLKEKGTVPELIPYRTAKYKKVKENYKQLTPDLQKVWKALFIRKKDNRVAQDQSVKLSDILPFPLKRSATMPICNKILKVDQTIYMCYDCGYFPSSVYCAKCFEDSEHKGHRYTATLSNGGTCDCGNIQSIKKEGFCKRHPGKANPPHIDPKQKETFLTYMRHLYQWFFKLQEVNGYQGLILLTHLVFYLDKLNNESLHYNYLTFQWMKTKPEYLKGISILEHMLIMGAKHFDTNFAKWATDMFLKMFCLEQFKIYLAEYYLIYFNKTRRFQQTGFKALFIQLFANSTVVEEVVAKKNISLNPKQREDYNSMEYFHQLLFMDSLEAKTARAFYLPIINSGGLDYCTLRYIEKEVQKGRYDLESQYKENWGIENGFYDVIKSIGSKFQDDKNVLAQELRNQLNMAKLYSFKKNKVIIPYQRAFSIYTLIYFKCDLMKIDPDQLMKACKLEKEEFINSLQNMLVLHLCCIREFSRSLGHRQYDNYIFDAYIKRYVQDKKCTKIFTLDSLALKVIAIILQKMGQVDKFNEVFLQVLKSQFDEVSNQIRWMRRDLQQINRDRERQREMMMKHYKGKGMRPEMMEDMDDFDHYMDHGRFSRGRFGMDNRNQSTSEFVKETKQKIARTSAIYFAQMVHYMFFIIESIFIERPEIIIGNDCQIDNPLVKKMISRQLTQIFCNAKEIPSDQMEQIIPFWFGDKLDSDEISKVAEFDKERKMYHIRPNIKGTPMCKDLLHSFIDNDTYIKYTSNEVQLTDTSKLLRNVYLSQTILNSFMPVLLDFYQKQITQKNVTLLKYLASLVKLLGLTLGRSNNLARQYRAKVMQFANKHNVAKQVQLIFEQSTELIDEHQKEQNKKRLEELRKRQKEKLKNITGNQSQNVKKILENNQSQQMYAEGDQKECLLCRGTDNLFYMGLYGESSFIFNTLNVDGTYPFFQSCFHEIHYECFLDICKSEQQIACPFCRNVCNILLPTEETLQNKQLLGISNERLDVISTIEARSKHIQNLTSYLTKSFIHLFFIFLMNEQKINPKKIKLYKIVLQILKKRYSILNKNEQKEINQIIQKGHQLYSESVKNYPLNQFIFMVNKFTLKSIKDQPIDNDCMDKIFKTCPNLSRVDIEKSIQLASILFGFNTEQKIGAQVGQQAKSLSEIVKLYTPPQNIKQLLKQRVQEEGLCKFGHKICICIICRKKGCADCGWAFSHTKEIHCDHSIFFNYISGGLIYVSNNNLFPLPCLYLNQKTGKQWSPQEKDEDFFLERKIYDEMIKALIEENLAEFMAKRLKQADIPLLF